MSSGRIISIRSLRNTSLLALALAASTGAAQQPYFYGAKVPDPSTPIRGGMGCSGLYGAELDACGRMMQQQALQEEDRKVRELDAKEKAVRDEKTRKAAELAAQRKRYDDEASAIQAREDRKPETHAARIRSLRSRIAYMQRIIDREHRIGETSGYVNRDTLYQAGTQIEYARDQIQSEYRLYRQTGGRKPLSAL